jgi:hypothetical protein
VTSTGTGADNDFLLFIYLGCGKAGEAGHTGQMSHAQAHGEGGECAGADSQISRYGTHLLPIIVSFELIYCTFHLMLPEQTAKFLGTGTGNC